jgi:plasmid stabilization system protein ParE
MLGFSHAAIRIRRRVENVRSRFRCLRRFPEILATSGVALLRNFIFRGRSILSCLLVSRQNRRLGRILRASQRCRRRLTPPSPQPHL